MPPISRSPLPNGLKRWQNRLHEIIFEADTWQGKVFDFALLGLILLSVAVVMADSVAWIHDRAGQALLVVEWIITIFFTIEYLLRIVSVVRPWRYVFSAFGIIDLLSILPTYLALFFPQTHYLVIVRSLRLLRIFRLLKLVHFVRESQLLLIALRQSRRRILVFLFFVLLVCCILGSAMYVVEVAAGSGFTSIPQSIYWAIVTLTTVGYGDITPVTGLGKLIASCIMIIGYSVIAIPTGLVSVEINRALKEKQFFSIQACPSCMKEGHDADARYCKFCGEKL